MFKITAPNEEYTREIAGVHFVEGTATTNNEVVARWLEGRGFTVDADEEMSRGEANESEPKQKNIGKMTVEELQNYANELGVDISGCANKEEKKSVIKAFLETVKE
ncbi:MAG: hypothetical protein ACK5MV_07605 [Aminipila sp.]